MTDDLKDKPFVKYLISFLTSLILLVGCYYYLKSPDKELSSYLCNAFFITGALCELMGFGQSRRPGMLMGGFYTESSSQYSSDSPSEKLKNGLPWIIVGLIHIAVGVILSYTL